MPTATRSATKFPLISTGAAFPSLWRSKDDAPGERLLITKGAPEGILDLSESYETEGRSSPLDAELAARMPARPSMT